MSTYNTNRHRVNPELYQATQLRTDGVHCRESAGTGPVVLKVILVLGAASSGTVSPWTNQCAPLFFHIYCWHVVDMCDIESIGYRMSGLPEASVNNRRKRGWIFSILRELVYLVRSSLIWGGLNRPGAVLTDWAHVKQGCRAHSDIRVPNVARQALRHIQSLISTTRNCIRDHSQEACPEPTILPACPTQRSYSLFSICTVDRGTLVLLTTFQRGNHNACNLL